MKYLLKNYHFYILSILSLNYLVPIYFFGSPTLFYADNLSAEVVYSKFIGEFALGNFESIDALTGHLKWEYLRRLFSPIFYIFALDNDELAYWIIDIILKLSSYFFFLLLAKKIIPKSFLAYILAGIFASMTDQHHFGFGMAIVPYLIYLILFKNKLKFYHFFTIVFFAINSDLITTVWGLFFIILVVYIIDRKKFFAKLRFIIIIITLFFIFLIISNIHLIYASNGSEILHREAFIREGVPIFENLLNSFLRIFKISLLFNFQLLFNFPYTIILLPSIILSIIYYNKQAFQFLLLMLLINILIFFFDTKIFAELQNSSQGVFRQFNFQYVGTSLPWLTLIFIIYLCKSSFKIYKLMIIPLLTSVVLFQLDSSIVPFVKTYIYKDRYKNYTNIYTFKGFFQYQDYKQIKEIVKDDRVVSVGLEPMVAAMNNIKIIDGYYNLYPLSYKKKFRRVIEEELTNKNFTLSKSYDKWGHMLRLEYLTPNDAFKNKIKFDEAKKLGANYVISKYKLNNKNLIFEKKINENVYLYKIF